VVKQPEGDGNYSPPLVPVSGMNGAVPLPYMLSWPGQGNLNLYMLYNKTYHMKVFCLSENMLIKLYCISLGF